MEPDQMLTNRVGYYYGLSPEGYLKSTDGYLKSTDAICKSRS